MPLLHLDLAGFPASSEQRTQLQSGLTKLMTDVLHKVGELTVVNIRQHAADCWSVGGRPLMPGEWTASLEVFITAGTNSETEQAAFISATVKLINQVTGQRPATPLYVVLHNVNASHWGYDGHTQQSRRQGSSDGEKPASLR
jgi:4-oxalocrotonate tautomerase